MPVTVAPNGKYGRMISFQTPLPPAEVYAYLADFSRHPEWVHDIVEMKVTGGEPGSAGTSYAATEAVGRMKASTSCVIDALEPPRRIAWSARTKESKGPMAMRSHWEFEIEPDGAGSRVTQRYDMDPPGKGSVMTLKVFGLAVDRLTKGMGASPKNVVRHAEALERILAEKAAATASARREAATAG